MATDADTAMTAPALSSATAQMEAIRDQWLRPLVDRIEELSRENGRLEQERDYLRAELAAMQAAATVSDTPQDANAGPLRGDTGETTDTPLQSVQDAQGPVWRRWWRRITGGG